MSLSRPPRSRWRTGITISLAVAALAATLFLSLHAWQEVADVKMSLAGTIALIIGIVITLAVSGGLMTMLFYSARHGHDDLHISPAKDKKGHDH